VLHFGSLLTVPQKTFRMLRHILLKALNGSSEALGRFKPNEEALKSHNTSDVRKRKLCVFVALVAVIGVFVALVAVIGVFVALVVCRPRRLYTRTFVWEYSDVNSDQGRRKYS
jgi:predicted transcriptional regulator